MTVDKQFQQMLKPLTASEAEAAKQHVPAQSVDDALSAVADKRIDFPMHMIPRGAESTGGYFYIVRNKRDLRRFFPEALSGSIGGTVDLYGRRDSTLKTGRHYLGR